MKPKFIRRGNKRYSKLGLRRKKKQVWRRPTGRDNKLRERRKDRGARVEIGYSKAKKEKGLIQGKKPVLVYNIKELEKAGKDSLVIIGKVGRKKKTEMMKKAKEMKLQVQNDRVKNKEKKK